MTGANMVKMKEKAADLEAQLKAAGVRVTVDDRDNYNPGWKYNYWELKGVPLRMELGPKDLEKGQVRLLVRVRVRVRVGVGAKGP